MLLFSFYAKLVFYVHVGGQSFGAVKYVFWINLHALWRPTGGMMFKGFVVAMLLPIVASAHPSVFRIMSIPVTYQGTAFAIKTSKGNLIITNNHICDKQIEMGVYVEGESLGRLSIVKFMDKSSDLCVLTGIEDAPALPLANTYKLGGTASYVGYPDNIYSTITGKIKDRYLILPMDIGEYKVYIGFEGHSDHGFSGSPLLNAAGEVIGVMARLSKDTKVGMAIPLETLKEFLRVHNLYP